MTKVTSEHHTDIIFTRDTKVNYKDGNALINSIFKKYDKDLSGDFNDEEWAKYQKDIESKTRNNVANHYDKKLQRIVKQYEKLENEYKKIDFSSWNQLLEFEKKHPNVSRNGLNKNESIPEGAMKYDLSDFEMGIYDKKNECFTGECYTDGYILGLETLSEEDKKEYLNLLEKASKSAKRAKALDKKSQALDAEYDKYLALKDCANSGYIKSVGSPEYEENIYQQYVEIRNNSNPFYKEIQKLEQERENLRLKGNPTQEDNARIEQINIRIEQLSESSHQWSITDSQSIVNFEQDSSKTNITFSPINPVFSEEITEGGIAREIGNTSTINVLYSNSNLNLNANVSSTQSYNITPQNNFNHSATGNLGIVYLRDNFRLNSTTEISYQKELSTYVQRVNVGYKNLEVSMSESVNHSQNESNSGTTYTTEVGVSHTIGKVTNSATANFAEEGNYYTLKSNAKFDKTFDKYYSVTATPSLSSAYNSGTHRYTVSPNLTLSGKYKSDRLSAGITCSEQFSSTMRHGQKPELNHNFTATGEVEYKDLKTNLKFNDSDSSMTHSNTYGVSLSYSSGKYGEFGAEYSYQQTQNKMPAMSNQTTQTLSLKYIWKFGLGTKK